MQLNNQLGTYAPITAPQIYQGAMFASTNIGEPSRIFMVSELSLFTKHQLIEAGTDKSIYKDGDATVVYSLLQLTASSTAPSRNYFVESCHSESLNEIAYSLNVLNCQPITAQLTVSMGDSLSHQQLK